MKDHGFWHASLRRPCWLRRFAALTRAPRRRGADIARDSSARPRARLAAPYQRALSHTAHAKLFRLKPHNDQGRVCEACHGRGRCQESTDKTLLVGFFSRSTAVEVMNHIRSASRANPAGSASTGRARSTSRASSRAATAATDGDSRAKDCCRATLGPIRLHQRQRAEFRRHSTCRCQRERCRASIANPHGRRKPYAGQQHQRLCIGATRKGGAVHSGARPVRENCMNCHVPLCSNHEKAPATSARVLCQQCHANDGHPTDLLTRSGTAAGASPDPVACAKLWSATRIHGGATPAGALPIGDAAELDRAHPRLRPLLLVGARRASFPPGRCRARGGAPVPAARHRGGRDPRTRGFHEGEPLAPARHDSARPSSTPHRGQRTARAASGAASAARATLGAGLPRPRICRTDSC